MAETRSPKVSSIQMNKKDPMRNLTITIQGYSGIFNTQPPDMIPDNATQEITNFLPIGQGFVRKIKAPQLLVTLPNTPIIMVNDVINGNLVMFVILADGSAGTVSNGTYTQVASAGTFSTTASNIQITNWQNQFFLIIDANKGYFAFAPNYTPSIVAWSANTAYAVGQIVANGSYYYWCITAGTSGSSAPSWTTTPGTIVKDNTVVWVCFSVSNGLLTLNPTLTSSSIIVYQGRVFISQNRNIQYSAPLSFIDWTSTNGGGTFSIASPNLKQKIVKLVAYMNNIYVIGDHAVIAITGTTITNDPSQWFIMEIFNTTGSIYPNSVINFNNVIYLVNEYGMWEIASSQSQKVDYPIDITQFSFTQQQSDIAMINNLNFWLIPINKYSQLYYQSYNMILAYCIDLQQFFYIDLGMNVNGIYATRSITDHNIYIISGNGIYQFNAGSSNLMASITSKVFDFGYAYVYKVFRYISYNLMVLSGTPNISLSAIVNSPTQTSSTVNSTPVTQFNLISPLLVYSPNISTPIPIKTSLSTPLYIMPSAITYSFFPVFYLNSGGTSIAFRLVDNSNSVFEILQTYIKGNIGRTFV
jgi:hypothetical protein